MPGLRTYNLFISHSWAYGDAYERLCNLLNQASNFNYKNFSVPKDDPIHNAPSSPALYAAIKNKISPCNVILIMAGKYATYSEWIKNEIKIASTEFLLSKPILAITPFGAQQISSIVRDAATDIAAWNTSSIVSKIRELA